MALSDIKDMKEALSAMKTELTTLREKKATMSAPKAGLGAVDRKALAQKASTIALAAKITGKNVEDMPGYAEVAELSSRAAILPADLPSWLAEEFTNDILERMTVLAKVSSFFPVYTLPDGTQTLSIPQKLSKTKAYLIAAGNDAVQSAITSGKVSFATQRLVTLTALSDQSDLETVVALAEVVKNDIAESLVLALEDAMINGDTDNAAGINGAVGANDHRVIFDGIRKITKTNGNQVDFGGNLTYANFLALRRALGKDGINQSNLIYVVSPSTFHRMLEIPELLTVDRYGSRATVITGEVGKIGQIPVVVSEFVPEDLNATGEFDAAGDKTTVVLVNKKMFGLARRNTVRFEQDRNIINATNIYVGHIDVDFKPLLPAKEISAVGINVPA